MGGRRTQGESSQIWRALAGRIDCAILAFDHAGAGRSEGPTGRLDPVRRVRDTRAALTWLTVRFPQLRDRIAIFGSSFGGAIATVAAASDRRAKALISLSTFSSGDTWLREMRPYWEFVAFLERLEADRRQRVQSGRSELVDPDEIMKRDPEAAAYVKGLQQREPGARFQYDLVSAELLLELDVVGAARAMRGRPSLFLHAEHDTLIPAHRSREVAEAAGGRFVLLRGLTHHAVYDGDALANVVEESAAFLAASLLDGSSDPPRS